MDRRATRIAQVMEWNFEEPGGIQAHVRGLASNLISHGYYVIVIMKKRVAKVNEYEFPTYYLKAPLSYPAAASPVSELEILTILKKEKIDLVHIHHIFSPFSISAALSTRRIKIPIVFTNHTIFFVDKKYLLNISFIHRMILNKASKIISVSKAADEIAEVYVKDKSKRIVIPNGVDSDLFVPSNSSPIPNSVCFCGRLVPRKGIHILIKAFSKIKNEIEDAKLFIIGDGRSRRYLESFARKLKVRDVIFTGYVDPKGVISYYQKSEVVVVPSIERESFGITAIEAMACGKPLIVTDVGGLPEIVIDNTNGIVVKKGASEELYLAIKRLLLDKTLAQRFGVNARDRVKALYDWESVIKRIATVYKEAV